MKIAPIVTSKYLRKEGFPTPALATIDHVELQDIAAPGEPEKQAWVLFFREYEKGLVLNTTNNNRLIAMCGSDDDAAWRGKQVVIYVDPTVEYGGKVMGGIRLRPPKSARGTKTAAPAAKPVAPEAAAGAFADLEDDVPEAEYDIP